MDFIAVMVKSLKRLQWKRDGKAAFVYIALFTLTLSILLTLGFEAIMLGHEPNLVYAPFSGSDCIVVCGNRNDGWNSIVLHILVGSYGDCISPFWCLSHSPSNFMNYLPWSISFLRKPALLGS